MFGSRYILFVMGLSFFIDCKQIGKNVLVMMLVDIKKVEVSELYYIICFVIRFRGIMVLLFMCYFYVRKMSSVVLELQKRLMIFFEFYLYLEVLNCKVRRNIIDVGVKSVNFVRLKCGRRLWRNGRVILDLGVWLWMVMKMRKMVVMFLRGRFSQKFVCGGDVSNV